MSCLPLAVLHYFRLTKGLPKNSWLQRHLADRNAIWWYFESIRLCLALLFIISISYGMLCLQGCLYSDCYYTEKSNLLGNNSLELFDAILFAVPSFRHEKQAESIIPKRRNPNQSYVMVRILIYNTGLPQPIFGRQATSVSCLCCHRRFLFCKIQTRPRPWETCQPWRTWILLAEVSCII